MIKFFRKIRQNLLKENLPDGQAGKTGKLAWPVSGYLKYAIGEIVLVVIGILIALQVNNWNEIRKIKNIEQALLMDLKVEIETSAYELPYIIDLQTTNLKTTIQLKTLMFKGKKVLDMGSLTIKKLITEMDHNGTYDPKLGILKSITTSRKLDYISNKELRYKLSSLNDLIIDTNKSTNEITKNRPLLYWTRISKYNERQSNYSLKYNKEKLFSDSEFIQWLGWLKSVREEGLEEENKLLVFLEGMIKTIDSEIEK